jgi:hypothetical protein
MYYFMMQIPLNLLETLAFAQSNLQLLLYVTPLFAQTGVSTVASSQAHVLLIEVLASEIVALLTLIGVSTLIFK